jgi:hypothetical protein
MIGTVLAHRTLYARVAGVALMCGLAGCAVPEPEPPPPLILESPAPPPKPVAAKPLPAAQSAVAEKPFAPEEAQTASTPSGGTVKVPDTQQATLPTPQQAPSLAGLSEGDVTKRFGKPANIRRTPSANIWTYQDQACTLDLFLFTDMRSGEQRVLTYQLSGSGREVIGERGCLERLGNNNNGKTG